MIVVPDSIAPKANEYNNIMTGLKRLTYRLSKANTPQKYLAAFDLAAKLINAFPLKSKMVWKAMRDGYMAGQVAPPVEGDVTGISATGLEEQ